MKLIECKLGPVEPMVGSTPYKFERDHFGRYVARVHDPKHVEILLSVEHYHEVPEEPEPVEAPKPAKQKAQDPAPTLTEKAPAKPEAAAKPRSGSRKKKAEEAPEIEPATPTGEAAGESEPNAGEGQPATE